MLDVAPDILMCDGHGLAHPRRLGIACHIGLLTDLPAIGVAKSRLTGSHEEPGREKGEWAPLVDKPKEGGRRQQRIGAVLRTRSGVKPVYVSPGHRLSLKTALALTLKCTSRYRLPEPVRLADKLSKSG
jgi:deoxyribonuclease V